MTVLPNTADPSCHTVIHPWAKEQNISGICPYPPSLEKHFKLNKIRVTFQDVPNRKTPKILKAYENCQVKLKILTAFFSHPSIRNIKTLDSRPITTSKCCAHSFLLIATFRDLEIGFTLEIWGERPASKPMEELGQAVTALTGILRLRNRNDQSTYTKMHQNPIQHADSKAWWYRAGMSWVIWYLMQIC